MKIMLISGHGAGDPGCVATMQGVTYREAEETIKVVNLLKPLLEPYAEVGAYDESRNAFEDAGSGILAARLKGWDYVLEIHFNARVGDYTGDGQTTGSEIFYPSRGKSSGAEDAIIRKLTVLGFKTGGARRSICGNQHSAQHGLQGKSAGSLLPGRCGRHADIHKKPTDSGTEHCRRCGVSLRADGK